VNLVMLVLMKVRPRRPLRVHHLFSSDRNRDTGGRPPLRLLVPLTGPLSRQSLLNPTPRNPQTVMASMLVGSLLCGAAVSVLCFVSGVLSAGIVLAVFTALAAGFFLLVLLRWGRAFGELMALAGGCRGTFVGSTAGDNLVWIS
jgi:hypothetical protein